MRVTQAPERLEVDPRTPFRGTEGQESPAAGPIGAYVWRTSLEHRGLLHPGGDDGEERWRGRGLLGDPSSCSATPGPAFVSRMGLIPRWHGVAGWLNLTADPVDDRPTRHPSQSFLLLSPLLSDRSTRRVSEQPDRDRLDCSRCLRSPLAHASLLPQPAPCIYAVKPHLHMAPTRDKHALPPLRIRAVQVFDTRPRADHGPVPTDTHLSRDNMPGSNCSGPPIRRHCRTQTRSCCTSAERR